MTGEELEAQLERAADELKSAIRRARFALHMVAEARDAVKEQRQAEEVTRGNKQDQLEEVQAA